MILIGRAVMAAAKLPVTVLDTEVQLPVSGYMIALGGIIVLLVAVGILSIRFRRIARQQEREKRAAFQIAEHLRVTLHAIGDGVIVTDPDENITLANPVAAELTGYSPEEMIGRKLNDVFRVVGAGVTLPESQARREPFKPEEADTYRELIARDGRRRHIADSVAPILDNSGTETGMILVFRDVTEAFCRRRRLEKTNSILQGILDHMPALVAVKDVNDDFRYVVWNRMAEELSGMSASEVVGKTDFELPGIRRYARQFRLDEERIVPGASVKIEKTMTFPNGSTRTLRTMLSRLQSGAHSSLLLVLALDFTEEKELEQERNKLTEELRRYAEQERLVNAWLEEVALDEVDGPPAVRQLLHVIKERLQAVHIHVFRFDYDAGKVIPLSEWSPEVPEGLLDRLPVVVLDCDRRWFRDLAEHQLLRIPDLEEEARKGLYGGLSDYLPRERLRAFYATGIWNRGRLWGYLAIGFGELKPELNMFEEKLLQSGAHIAEIILERRINREREKRDEYEKLLIMETLKIPILLFDPDMKLIRCNNAALGIAGIPEEQVYRQECWQTFCGRECRPVDCPVLLTCGDGQEHSREIHIGNSDFLLTAYPIVIDGKLVNILKTLIDVTAFNETQNRLTAALREAESASKAKSSFLATMSHELRTPLNAVIGFSELLQNGRLPESEQLDYLRSINLAGNALLSLINDVLDLSRIEADQMPIVPQPTDVAELVQEIQAIFRYKVQEKKLYFTLTCPADLPLMMLDQLRLRQILLNLIGNAVKFTESGGISLCVTFQERDRNRGALILSIQDTGIGIKPEAQQKIFEPFIQQDAIRDSRIYHGTGLGLAISRRLVQNMGGHLRVESRENEGSNFIIELPDVLRGGDRGKQPLLPLPTSPGATLFPLRVLAVDDVPMNLKVLAAILRKEGSVCMVANSGKEALEMLSREAVPDLILTDMWMPEMDGAELARAVRQRPELAGVKIVAVTADTEAGSNFPLGDFDGILLKPLTGEKLRKLFQSLCPGGAA